jgi:hypothetical protein
VALHKKAAIRVARSSGLYQKLMKKIMPGKIPASAAPKANRSPATPAKLVVPAMAAQMAPKLKVRKPSHLGRVNRTPTSAEENKLPVWSQSFQCQVGRELENAVGDCKKHQSDCELIVCHVVGLWHAVARGGVENFCIA